MHVIMVHGLLTGKGVNNSGLSFRKVPVQNRPMPSRTSFGIRLHHSDAIPIKDATSTVITLNLA
jgi:hypothetical protein